MITTQIESFIHRFFEDPNKITLSHIQQPGHTYGKVAPWIEQLRGSKSAILPYWNKKSSSITWFAIAFNKQDLQVLQEDWRSFLGSTYAKVENISSPSDQPEYLLVEKLSSGNYFAFSGDDRNIIRQLQFMYILKNKRPARTTEVLPTLDRVLRDFDLALQAKERNDADKLLIKLERQYQLDSRNILFLRLKVLATFDCWHEILNMPRMKDLLQMRRPWSVTETLLQAVYKQKLASYEINPTLLIERFQEKIYPEFASLFRYQAQRNTKPEVLKIFMLYALTESQGRPWIKDLEQQIKGTDLEPIYQYWNSQLTQRAPVTVETSIDQTIQQLIAQSEYSSAFELLKGLPASKETVASMVKCAFELQTLDTSYRALQAVDSLGTEDQQSLQTNRWFKFAMEHLKGDGKYYRVPTNWLEWIDNLALNSAHSNVEFVRRGATEWNIREWIRYPDTLKNWIEKWESLANDVDYEEILNNSIPYLLENLKQDECWNHIEWQPLHRLLFYHLADHTKGDHSDLIIISELGIVLARQELSKDESMVIQTLRDLWNNFGNPQFVDWIVAWFEQSESRSSLDRYSRVKLFIEVDRRIPAHRAQDRWKTIKLNQFCHGWEQWFDWLMGFGSDRQLVKEVKPMTDNMYWAEISVETIRQLTETITTVALDSTHPDEAIIAIGHIGLLIDQMNSALVMQNSKFVSLYQALIDLIIASSECNGPTLHNLVLLSNSVLYFRPLDRDKLWQDIRDWLEVSPNSMMAADVFELIELFLDYGIAGDEIKQIWDEWSYQISSSGTSTAQLDYIIRLGKRCAGSHDTIQNLLTRFQSKDPVDPIATVPVETVSIFTLRPGPAERVVKEITNRNPNLKIRICAETKMSKQVEVCAKSDLVVIVTSCLTHAIFYGISPLIQGTTLYPRSPGESAILDCLEHYASSLN
ncbi:hypothetical protein H8B09_19685 [Paenibacillus sp. PR3]|uniref:Uncharacterized protein n=1 Tax=Paenibacillus terricola TaxID=2763503 RepID=A0ABR8MYI0_9BACL|nr:hypothetical protein [Paenibacillus terricola]MBD3920997.1 hypothetical protein [Paenibacillus terricola]